MAQYYKSHELRVCTRGDELYVGTYEDQQAAAGGPGPFSAFLQAGEARAPVICVCGWWGRMCGTLRRA